MKSIVMSAAFLLLFLFFAACTSVKDTRRPSPEKEYTDLFREEENKEVPDAEQKRQEADDEIAKEYEETDITDEDIKKYIEASRNIQKVAVEIDEKIDEIVGQYGLELERFKEIREAKYQGRDMELDDEKREMFKIAQRDVEEIQPELHKKQERKIKDAGLDFQRFQEISISVQQNPAVRQRYIELAK